MRPPAAGFRRLDLDGGAPLEQLRAKATPQFCGATPADVRRAGVRGPGAGPAEMDGIQVIGWGYRTGAQRPAVALGPFIMQQWKVWGLFLEAGRSVHYEPLETPPPAPQSKSRTPGCMQPFAKTTPMSEHLSSDWESTSTTEHATERDFAEPEAFVEIAALANKLAWRYRTTVAI